MTSTGVVLVTGGGRGIGAATSVALARRGWDVCITWNADERRASEVAAACRGHGSRAVVVHVDISVESDVLRAFDAADGLGRLSGVVNNAGVLARQCRVESMDVARVERIVSVNVVGTILCCREAVLRMSTARGGAGGSIVNVSSRAAVLGGAHEYVDYAASKAAVDALTVGLAKEAAADGVRVNGVRPALVRTEIHASGGDPDRVDRLADRIPMGRGGQADEVAAAICWLLSGESPYTTGAIIDVAGGL